jgi:hypothetical protein
MKKDHEIILDEDSEALLSLHDKIRFMKDYKKSLYGGDENKLKFTNLKLRSTSILTGVIGLAYVVSVFAPIAFYGEIQESVSHILHKIPDVNISEDAIKQSAPFVGIAHLVSPYPVIAALEKLTQKIEFKVLGGEKSYKNLIANLPGGSELAESYDQEPKTKGIFSKSNQLFVNYFRRDATGRT